MAKGISYLFDPEALVAARTDAGLTVGDVVKRTGLNRDGLKAAEFARRKTFVNRKMLQALAEIYGVEPHTLMRTKHSGKRRSGRAPSKPRR